MADPRWYPALEVSWRQRPPAHLIDELLAVVDDFGPTAVDDDDDLIRIFFGDHVSRDRALDCVRVFSRDATCTPLTISDEAWAERSQAALTAVQVGRFVIRPPWAPAVSPPDPTAMAVTIQPSMGFGTGHHASTRLCLQLLQESACDGQSVLDVGTGSGVLAIAAALLGASRVLGIDCDPDALASARENVVLNAVAVELRPLDLAWDADAMTETFDLVTANLTGAMLERYARTLRRWVGPAGRVIASGFQVDEERGVSMTFEHAGLSVCARSTEAGWVALGFRGDDASA